MSLFLTRESDLPECSQNRLDCMSNKKGCCVALNNTKFNKKCPFYKSRAQAEEERKKWSRK